MITATYVSATTFTVSGDRTAEFHVGRRVKHVGDTTGYGTIESVSIPVSDTQIVLTAASDDLDASLTGVYYGVVSSYESESSIPIHSHDGDEGSGGVLSYFGIMLPTHYERAARPARSTADTLTIYAGTVINVNEKIFLVASNTALELNTNATWDTGTALNDAARAGNDYYIYACDNSGVLALLVSANSTTPTGYDSDTSRKVGGFHCLCVAVGTIGGHTLTGFAQGEILPQSVWDLKHRPICEPAGMVWSDEAQIWVDIYLASGTGGSTASVNGGTISDTRDWMDFVDDFGAVKKQLLDDPEFQLIAAGSNEETNITGSADPVTTGGHSDTAARRMISNIGCEDCCGVSRQWLRDQSAMYDDAVVVDWYDLPGSKGSLYRPVDTNDVKLHAGGSWAHAAYCGSRCRHAYFSRWDSHMSIGGRGRSRKL